MKSFYTSLLALTLLASCAKTYTLYETGRPNNVQSNNAKQIVGEQWNITYTYKANPENIMQHNDSVNAMLNEKYGENWLNTFNDEVHAELELNTTIRTSIMKTEIYLKSKEALFEPTILLKKKGDSYIAYIVGQQKSDDSRLFITFARLMVKDNGLHIDVKDDTIQPLALTFPQNGIE